MGRFAHSFCFHSHVTVSTQLGPLETADSKNVLRKLCILLQDIGLRTSSARFRTERGTVISTEDH